VRRAVQAVELVNLLLQPVTDTEQLAHLRRELPD
jgi:hypothetical protein